MSLIKSASTVSFWTFISRLSGFARDVVVAIFMGAGALADAFFIAFKLPNLFRRLFAEGAFNAVFIPIFSGKLHAPDHLEAKLFARRIMSILLLVLVAITLLAQFYMPALMRIVAPGFVDDNEQFALVVTLSRITFGYLLCISIVSLFTGMLNSIGKFAAGAVAPVLLNLCLIMAVVTLHSITETVAHALAIGVMVAGVVQSVWMVIQAKRCNMLIFPSRPVFSEDTKILLKRMVPGIIGAGVTQINVWVDMMLATLISGAVSYLYYADRLSQFPLAIIGTAIGTAMLPSLSRYIKHNQEQESARLQQQAIKISLLLTLPATVGLIMLALPIIEVVFMYGAFTQQDALNSSRALIAFACGLPAFVLIKIFAPSFFARGNTKTPMKIAACCVLVNILLDLLWIKPYGFVGLAAATSVAAWCNAFALGSILYQRKHMAIALPLLLFLAKLLISVGAMAMMIFLLLSLTETFFLTNSRIIDAISLFAIMFAAMLVYALMVMKSKAYRFSDLKKDFAGNA